MRVENLMLGNWVELNQCMSTTHCRVKGIYPDGTVHLDKAERLFRQDELYPVLITPEILEKNGWKKKSGYWVLKGFETRLGWKLGQLIVGYSATPKPIFCVHELQNMMKVLGIEKDINLDWTVAN